MTLLDAMDVEGAGPVCLAKFEVRLCSAVEVFGKIMIMMKKKVNKYSTASILVIKNVIRDVFIYWLHQLKM